MRRAGWGDAAGRSGIGPTVAAGRIAEGLELRRGEVGGNFDPTVPFRPCGGCGRAHCRGKGLENAMDEPMPANLLLRVGALNGERPGGDERRQKLFWVDIREPALHLFDPITARDVPHRFDLGAHR